MIDRSRAGQLQSGEATTGIRRFGGLRNRQQGMSLIGLIIAAFTIFFAALLVMKIVPLYLTDQKISSIFKQLKGTSAGTPHDIRRTINKQLDINEIDEKYNAKDFSVKPFGNGYRVEFNYDGKAHILGNLYVVAEFRHQVNVSGR